MSKLVRYPAIVVPDVVFSPSLKRYLHPSEKIVLQQALRLFPPIFTENAFRSLGHAHRLVFTQHLHTLELREDDLILNTLVLEACSHLRTLYFLDFTHEYWYMMPISVVTISMADSELRALLAQREPGSSAREIELLNELCLRAEIIPETSLDDEELSHLVRLKSLLVMGVNNVEMTPPPLLEEFTAILGIPRETRVEDIAWMGQLKSLTLIAMTLPIGFGLILSQDLNSKITHMDLRAACTDPTTWTCLLGMRSLRFLRICPGSLTTYDFRELLTTQIPRLEIWLENSSKLIVDKLLDHIGDNRYIEEITIVETLTDEEQARRDVADEDLPSVLPDAQLSDSQVDEVEDSPEERFQYSKPSLLDEVRRRRAQAMQHIDLIRQKGVRAKPDRDDSWLTWMCVDDIGRADNYNLARTEVADPDVQYCRCHQFRDIRKSDVVLEEQFSEKKDIWISNDV